MPQDSSVNYYSELTIYDDLSCIADIDRFTDIPEDWYIVVADIMNSTQAVAQGMYREVNMVGASVIISALNASGNISIPYVFGGDGATLCIPPHLLEPVKTALAETQRMAEKMFGIYFHLGMVPVRTVLDAGHRLRVARCRMSEYLVSAMFIGDGLAYAEDLVKAGRGPVDMVPSIPASGADDVFEGLECRWEEISSRHGETITLLVKASSEDDYQDSIIYAEVLAEIRNIFGEDHNYHPLHTTGLRLSHDADKLKQEYSVRTFGKGWLFRVNYWLKLRVQYCIGRLLMGKKFDLIDVDWSNYLPELIENSDYKKFDGMLRMVIAGSSKNRKRLEKTLKHREENGDLKYGIHLSDSAQITCIVYNHKHEHIHFVDGTDGGYTMAATVLKGKMS